MHLIRAQPLPARKTFRIDALHGPAGKILHVCPQNFSAHPLEKLGGFCGKVIVVSRKKPQLVVGMLRDGSDTRQTGKLNSGSHTNSARGMPDETQGISRVSVSGRGT